MSLAPSVDQRIRSASRPNCALCGSNGVSIYLEQQDRLFGAGGAWNFKKCRNRKCGLIWLDPMPLEEDIGKAYVNYYTHAGTAAQGRIRPKKVGALKQFYRLIKRGYLAGKYGYERGAASFTARSVGKLLYLFPFRRSRLDAEVRFLRAVPQGRLLDVGCGSGRWLEAMRELGWQVEGVDFDEQVVKAATDRGLAVRGGSLEQQNFPKASFDAVTLSHVIEHVPDPVRTLTECARILKEGGKLVLWTPNGSSLGHTIFRQHWRGLEPPRHLHIFSPGSMRALLNKAGFSRSSIWTRNSFMIWQHSLVLRKGQSASDLTFAGRLARNIASGLLSLLETTLLTARVQAGELLDVRASKAL